MSRKKPGGYDRRRIKNLPLRDRILMAAYMQNAGGCCSECLSPMLDMLSESVAVDVREAGVYYRQKTPPEETINVADFPGIEPPFGERRAFFLERRVKSGAAGTKAGADAPEYPPLRKEPEVYGAQENPSILSGVLQRKSALAAPDPVSVGVLFAPFRARYKTYVSELIVNWHSLSKLPCVL